MAYRINFEKYAANFSLPAEIVDGGLTDVNSDYLKVILLIFRNANKSYSTNLIANLLNLPESKVEDAISYWVQRDVLQSQKSESIPPRVIAMSGHTPQSAIPEPAPNSELSYLLECMENQLKRPVTSAEYRTVVHIMEFIKLPADVILMAMEYCVSIDKMNARYMEKVCINWMENGITTHEAAEQYLNFLKNEKKNETAVKKMFGIDSRNLIDSERKTIERWFYEYQFSTDMIEFAYERMITAIGKLSFPYIDKILKTWHEKGYRTLDDVTDNEGGTRRRKNASYDIDELDRYWDNVPKLD